MTNWQELRLVDAQGNGDTTLGDAIDAARRLGEASEFDERSLTLAADGSVDSWNGYFVAADGEEPAWDTPECDVDWTGFADAVSEVRQNAEAAMGARNDRAMTVKSERTYNGGGGGSVTAYLDGREYSCDCYVDDSDYDLQDAQVDGCDVDWDVACKEWPEAVREALHCEASQMIDDYKTDASNAD